MRVNCWDERKKVFCCWPERLSQQRKGEIVLFVAVEDGGGWRKGNAGP